MGQFDLMGRLMAAFGLVGTEGRPRMCTEQHCRVICIVKHCSICSREGLFQTLNQEHMSHIILSILWLPRFKEHEVEQDEPVCKMVTERKCRDVQGEKRLFKNIDFFFPILTVKMCFAVPVSPEVEGEERRRRQSGEEDVLSLGQECEDWPVQKVSALFLLLLLDQ